MAAKRTVQLELGGTRFRMTSDAEEAHLAKLSTLVNERVTALSAKARTATPAQLLAMAALGLADDLVATDKRLRSIEDTTRRAIEGAIARIDRRLEADAVSRASDAE